MDWSMRMSDGTMVHARHVANPEAWERSGMEVWQLGERAWWDLEPRGNRGDPVANNVLARYQKPSPRKGYGATTNARLAKALTMGLKEAHARELDELVPELWSKMTAPKRDTGVLMHSVTWD